MIFSILFYIVECETSNDLTEREKKKKGTKGFFSLSLWWKTIIYNMNGVQCVKEQIYYAFAQYVQI